MSESGTEQGWHPSPFEDIGVGLRRRPLPKEERSSPLGSRPVPESAAPEPITAPEPPTVPDSAPPIQPEAPLGGLLRKLAAPFIALFALILKFKTALLLVFKLKLFTVAGSMLVSLAAYTAIWGWRFALGFVVLLAVHELGHVLEAKRQRLPVSAPVFLPFVGAGILIRKMPHNAWHEAQLALAGPIVGSIGSAGLWGVGLGMHSELLQALGFTGFFLNLFNLLPVVPLDGGRAVAAIHPALWLVGLAGLAALTLVMPNPILIIIVLLAAYDLLQRWRMRHAAHEQRYYEVAGWQRLTVAALYFGLAALLVVAMSHSHLERHL
jgi:Zn-dependent protease